MYCINLMVSGKRVSVLNQECRLNAELTFLREVTGIWELFGVLKWWMAALFKEYLSLFCVK